MKLFKRALIALLVFCACGLIALAIAIFMAETGMLGTCFEGSCGYAGLFFALPLGWLILLAISSWLCVGRIRARHHE